MFAILQTGIETVLEIAEIIEGAVTRLGGRTPFNVDGIIVVKEEDMHLAELLMPLLGLSFCWLIKNDDSYFDAVRNIRNPRRSRIVIATASVGKNNQEDIGRAVSSLKIKKAIVKSAKVFSFSDHRLKGRSLFEVVTL